ncbi:hypothetical protein CN287_06515, partial [Bacillus cereus]
IYMIYIEFYINYKRNKRFNFQFFYFYILFITIPLMHNKMNIILKEKWSKLIFIPLVYISLYTKEIYS